LSHHHRAVCNIFFLEKKCACVVLGIKYSLREKKNMISLRVTVGVVLIFLEVCTFGFTEENASSINNATTTTVIKNSSIFDDGTTKSFDVDATTTISMTTSALPPNFQLPENCSDYKVLFTLIFSFNLFDIFVCE